MNHSMPGLLVHHQLPEFTQTHAHWTGDATQPSSSVVPFSSCPQSLPESGSFPMSQLLAWVGQSTGVLASASVLPMNTQGWSPLGWTGWISLQSKGLSSVFSNTTVQKHQFFGAQLSLQSNSHILHDHWKNHSLDKMDLCWQSNVSAFWPPVTHTTLRMLHWIIYDNAGIPESVKAKPKNLVSLPCSHA